MGTSPILIFRDLWDLYKNIFTIWNSALHKINTSNDCSQVSGSKFILFCTQKLTLVHKKFSLYKKKSNLYTSNIVHRNNDSVQPLCTKVIFVYKKKIKSETSTNVQPCLGSTNIINTPWYLMEKMSRWSVWWSLILLSFPCTFEKIFKQNLGWAFL